MMFISDGGKKFYCREWKQICKQYKCMRRLTSPHNHHSYPVERCMRKLGTILRAACSEIHSPWVKMFKPIEICYNFLVHKCTKIAPVKLHQNQERLEIPNGLGAQIDIKKRQKLIKKSVLDNLKASANKRNQQN